MWLSNTPNYPHWCAFYYYNFDYLPYEMIGGKPISKVFICPVVKWKRGSTTTLGDHMRRLMKSYTQNYFLRSGYGGNPPLNGKMGRIRSPSRTFMFGDGNPVGAWNGTQFRMFVAEPGLYSSTEWIRSTSMMFRHERAWNGIYVDSHVESWHKERYLALSLSAPGRPYHYPRF